MQVGTQAMPRGPWLARPVGFDALDDGQRWRRPAADDDLDGMGQSIEHRAPLRPCAAACLGTGGIQVDRRHSIDSARLFWMLSREVAGQPPACRPSTSRAAASALSAGRLLSITLRLLRQTGIVRQSGQCAEPQARRPGPRVQQTGRATATRLVVAHARCAPLPFRELTAE